MGTRLIPQVPSSKGSEHFEKPYMTRVPRETMEFSRKYKTMGGCRFLKLIFFNGGEMQGINV